MKSEYFTAASLRGLTRMGDVFIPAYNEFPSFSELGCIEMVDNLIAYLPEEDVSLLNMVLTIFSLMPVGFLKWLVRTMENSLDKVGTLPSLMRQLNMGLRGIIFGCYYSGRTGAGYHGKNPLDIIGYHINRVED
jgi:hypothetical protein